MKLRPQHWQEWRNSGIAPEIIEANVQSLDNAHGWLLYGDKLPRRNDGRLSNGILSQYRHLEEGGWYCSGLDSITLEDSQWGCFKPDRPRLSKDGKPIKYEHPPKITTEAFCLKITRHQWRQIAKKGGLDCPDLENIPNEEIAQSFWQWVKNNSVAIVITEGAKKTASLLSHGYAALGLPGIYSGYRCKDTDGVELVHKQLIPQLEAFCQEGREFIFCFDNDDKPTTRKNVRKAIANTGRLMEFQGCKVTVMTWAGSAKGIDDVIVGNGETSLDRIYFTRQSLEAYKLTEFTDLTPLISQTVNSRYLEPDILAKVIARLVGMKAAKGTGKTEILAQRVEKAIAEGMPVIVLTHREQLAKELAKRFGLPYRSELEFGAESFNGYVLCVDSLHPHAKPAFDPARYPDALVILDEAEQVIWHLLNSSTCQRNRPAILETLTELLNGAGQIILSDADLTRISLDYLNGLLTTQAAPWVVVNEYNPANVRKAFLYDKPEALFSDALECIQNGERLMIHTGAQKVSSKWGTINLEITLSGAFPELKILRIDAESVAEPGHPAYGVMGNLNAVLPLYDIVIASPTLETGVSIDIKGHFHRVFCFAPGSQTAEAVCQSLARVREDIPRHLWVKKYSNQRIGNGSTIPKILINSQQKLFQANSLLLGQAEALANLDGHSPRHLATWATYAAIHNHGFKKYRDVILSRLEAEGYAIISPDPPDDGQSIGELMKAYTEANYQEHCEKVAAAPLLDDLEFDRISKARAKSEPERLSEQKTAISKRYLTDEITPELVTQDNKGLYGQLQLRYYLTMGREFLADRDNHRVKKLSKQTGEAFTPDINSACYSAKVKTLEIINIGQFLDGSAHTSESLRDWFKHICQFRHDIKTFLNQSINPEGDAPIAVAQRLLGLMGLKMTRKQCRINGGRQRIYALVDPPPGDAALAIMERWFERDSNRVTCHTSPLKELCRGIGA
ncbi:DUF3854 domain-containing protein [Synechocystis sp. LEGE 06083]|uniref:plasmid replication protein, CyRepA1 family n=1 Tax=Synechocystis sp. LEGE 06083 TaxID=915336 RepID=UPI0018819E80|nr:plasmid replication protein, CyRepA1 family [Synechocystis sp. LEGE 06083]MBE9193790.1 DUF3854 domain-containing protein [Synechocystis sp. LEGE 06083]